MAEVAVRVPWLVDRTSHRPDSPVCTSVYVHNVIVYNQYRVLFSIVLWNKTLSTTLILFTFLITGKALLHCPRVGDSTPQQIHQWLCYAMFCYDICMLCNVLLCMLCNVLLCYMYVIQCSVMHVMQCSVMYVMQMDKDWTCIFCLHIQSTFFGRWRHFMDIIDPQTLFTSQVSSSCLLPFTAKLLRNLGLPHHTGGL